MNHPNISGIHHITAICASPVENLHFYETTLGLRLVKQTVNFDDPATYHLYYGDDNGAPGTILTFFPWENLLQGRPGAGMVTAIAFGVPKDSLLFWTERMTAAGISFETTERFGEPVIGFVDPHGLPLELIGVKSPAIAFSRKAGSVPQKYAIAGFHSATATLHTLAPISSLLKGVLGMTLSGQEQNRYRFSMDVANISGQHYDVLVDKDMQRSNSGTGTVHHIAFRTENDMTQMHWQSLLRESGLSVTDVRDRQYFRSIYFHSPGGVLFEIATDSPGFAVDESPAHLGESLKLPPQFEPMRAAIKKHLPPLRVKKFKHVFQLPGKTDDGWTTVTLHGSGGNEIDLLDLAQKVSPAAAILGVRGRVMENGGARFFKRPRANGFDEEDIIGRARELAVFLTASAARYGRDRDRLCALGYSNGANMTAAILFLLPDIFAQAVLLRPMQPLHEPSLPNLQGKRVLVLRGSHDRIIPPESTDILLDKLQTAGAELTVKMINAGHEITMEDIMEIRNWVLEHRLTTLR